MKAHFFVFLLGVFCLAEAADLVPVTGFCEELSLFTTFVKGATLSVLEHPEWGEVKSAGDRGEFKFPDTFVGDKITVKFSKLLYHTMYTSTITVPEGGCIGPYHEISVQVFTEFMFVGARALLPGPQNTDKCQFLTTVSAYHKTLADDPQGEEGAVLYLTPDPGPSVSVFYYGINKATGKTDPTIRDLTSASLDGGVWFSNVPASTQPYTMYAVKDGVEFTTAEFHCPPDRAGSFVNAAPSWGPTVIKPVPKQ